MQIVFATLPNGHGEKLSSSFLSEHCLSRRASEFSCFQSSKYVEIRSENCFRFLGMEMEDEKVSNRSNARAFTTLRPRSLLTPPKSRHPPLPQTPRSFSQPVTAISERWGSAALI
jgi:hypothetical protein